MNSLAPKHSKHSKVWTGAFSMDLLYVCLLNLISMILYDYPNVSKTRQNANVGQYLFAFVLWRHDVKLKTHNEVVI